MTANSEKEVFQRTAEEFRATLQSLIESHHELNQRAVDLAKVNVLSVSLVASGITVVGVPDYFLLFVFGFLSMIVSMGYCIHVYRPRDMNLGLGPPDALDNIEDAVEDDIGEAEYYRQLCKDLEKAINMTDMNYKKEVRSFRVGLWATVGGILFFSSGLLPLVLPTFTSGAEYLLSFLILLFTIGARGLYTDN